MHHRRSPAASQLSTCHADLPLRPLGRQPLQLACAILSRDPSAQAHFWNLNSNASKTSMRKRPSHPLAVRVCCRRADCRDLRSPLPHGRTRLLRATETAALERARAASGLPSPSTRLCRTGSRVGLRRLADPAAVACVIRRAPLRIITSVLRRAGKARLGTTVPPPRRRQR